MSIIYIEKISESQIRDSSSEDIETELSQYFSFDVPGAKYSPLFKAKRWDGKIRLYNSVKKTLLAGLYDTVLVFANKNSYTVEITQNKNYSIVKENIKIDREVFGKWVDSLDIHGGNQQKITPRDYQIDAAISAIENQRIILLSPT